MTPNALATALTALGILLALAGVTLGQVDLGEGALLSFALLIALNCQKWEEGMR